MINQWLAIFFTLQQNLYDTNLKDELYYQDLGFFDTTKKGNHGEPLLVYKPKNLETNKKEKPIKSLFKKVFNINQPTVLKRWGNSFL